MAVKLSDTAIQARLAELAGWSLQEAQIQKRVKLASFPGAIAFVMQVAFLAEAAKHHPDIDIRYKTVTLTLTTHDAGGLSDKDFDLALQVERLLG